MKKIFNGYLLCAVLFFGGCATVQPKVVPGQEKIVKDEEVKDLEIKLEDVSPQLQNIKQEELEEYVQEKGVIFAKTDFQGLLQTSYVKFLFVDQDDPSHTFQLHIGDKSKHNALPWREKVDIRTVKPGYFFVELPAGRYKISSVSIPVGSTLATEAMDVSIDVVASKVCYIGTLKMVGIKEKIRLGGVPVIKPGFEYTVEVFDKRDEGVSVFYNNYPEFSGEIISKIMQVNSSVIK